MKINGYEYQKFNWITRNVAIGGFMDCLSEHQIQERIKDLYTIFDVIVFCCSDIYPDRKTMEFVSREPVEKNSNVCWKEKQCIECFFTDTEQKQDLTEVYNVIGRLIIHSPPPTKILFSCHGGYNRSSFVAANYLMGTYHLKPDTTIDLIQKLRDGTLTNNKFTKLIREFKSDIRISV